MVSARRTAFSLVELSIVLVILGLLTGGILAGQSLIRGAELRAVSTEFGRYATAISGFRDKYFALPGDFSKASTFGWGPITGNADGFLQNNSVAPGSNEISTFWIHLSNAGLIEGSYTNTGGTALTSGTHNPRSKVNSANWNAAGLGNVSVAGVATPTPGLIVPAATTFFAGSYNNVLLLGGGTDALLPSGVLKPEEAWNIDTKMDDGKPDLGSVLTLESQGENDNTRCSNQDGNTTAIAPSDFVLSNSSSTACSLVFKTGY